MLKPVSSQPETHLHYCHPCKVVLRSVITSNFPAQCILGSKKTVHLFYSDGLGYGNNARAALITRGLVEISRMALKLGADPLTLAGLAGMGDLVLTCTGDPRADHPTSLFLGLST